MIFFRVCKSILLCIFFFKNGLHIFVNQNDFSHQFGRFIKPLFFKTTTFFFQASNLFRKRSKEVARNWSGLLIDFFEDPRCHVNRPGSKCLVSWLLKLRCCFWGWGFPYINGNPCSLFIMGEYLYFRYLKYVVIAFFFWLGGGAIGLCPFFFGHAEL